MESNHQYYLRRAAAELQRAAQAVTDVARERHLVLAKTFSERAERRHQKVTIAGPDRRSGQTS